jgi:hypothetical protein
LCAGGKARTLGNPIRPNHVELPCDRTLGAAEFLSNLITGVPLEPEVEHHPQGIIAESRAAGSVFFGDHCSELGCRFFANELIDPVPRIIRIVSNGHGRLVQDLASSALDRSRTLKLIVHLADGYDDQQPPEVISISQ